MMQAYALAGDRAAALAQYETCREALLLELGIEPAPETVALLEAIKAGRYSRMATDELIRPPARTRHNLSADATPFIGREIELAEIGRLLTHERRRLVTIVGPGGMGKTRLAQAVGMSVLPQFEDGVYFVDLAPVEQPEDIVPAIAAALEYTPPDPALELKPQLLGYLGRRNLLLILDNFEQIPGGAAVAGEILRSCPGVALLITSRERLNLTSESRYELGGLEYPATLLPDDAMDYTAVRLFVDSGRRVRPGFELTGNNVADVVRICRLVRGMPLGLILASGWLELLTTAEIAAEIERGLEFLATDMADLPERQRSMRAVFDRSWRALAPEEQAVMARLSIFRGGFTREAAENVAGANLRVLLLLVNESLLQRRAEDGRFDIHELLLQYAAERRRMDDPDGVVGLAHCNEFARLVDTEVRQTFMIYPVYVPARLVAEPDNIRRAWAYAVEHGLSENLTKLAGGIYALGFAEGINPRTLFEQGLQSIQERGALETHPAVLRLRLMVLRSLWGFDEISRVRNLSLEFVQLVEEGGDPELLFWFYIHLGHITQDRNAEVLVWAEKAIQAAREMGDHLYIKRAEANELYTHVYMGLQDQKTLKRLEAILTYLESKFPTVDIIIQDLLGALSSLCLSLHIYDQAVYYGTRSLNIAKIWRSLHQIGGTSSRLAEIRLEMGAPREAADHLLDNLDWHLAIGQVWQTLGAMFSVVLGFIPLFGGNEKAVPILSMVYHHSEAIPLYREYIAAALPRLEAEMGAEAYAAAWERGKALDFDTAVAQMRAILSDNRI